jgi:hypothetical protein
MLTYAAADRAMRMRVRSWSYDSMVPAYRLTYAAVCCRMLTYAAVC